MKVQHYYYDGCNGEQVGDSCEGTVEECAAFLLDTDTISGQYDPDGDPEDHSLNDWTLEEAKQELLESVGEILTVDRQGDQQSWLAVTE